MSTDRNWGRSRLHWTQPSPINHFQPQVIFTPAQRWFKLSPHSSNRPYRISNGCQELAQLRTASILEGKTREQKCMKYIIDGSNNQSDRFNLQPDPSASFWVKSQVTNVWSRPVEASRNVEKNSKFRSTSKFNLVSLVNKIRPTSPRVLTLNDVHLHVQQHYCRIGPTTGLLSH